MNQKEVYVNPDLLRYIESAPDTILTFIDDRTLMVKESPEEIIKQILNYKKQIFIGGNVKSVEGT